MADRPQQKRRSRDLRDRMTGGHNVRSGHPAEQRQQQNGSAPSRSEFTFSSDTRGPQFPPAGPSLERGPQRNRGRGRGRGGASGKNSARPYIRGGDASVPSHHRGRHNKPYSRRQAPHERALLQTRDDNTEHFLGVAANTKKFRDLADLSDDEEADMDTDSENSEDNNSATAQGKTKVARTQSSSRADGNSVPKWSNPDPYTVLPPPEETTGKRIDFVKLIRKAKNEVAEQNDATNAVAANDDFISFGEDDNGGVHALDRDQTTVTSRSHRSSQDHSLQGSLNEVAATGSLASANHHAKRSAEAAGLPARPQHAGSSLKRKRARPVGMLTDCWQPYPDCDLAPWARRHDLERLRNDPAKLIRCFGSFPIGLYLPTADMDLVYVSDSLNNGGAAVLPQPKYGKMKNIADKLVRMGVASYDPSPLIISKARVPIIKFNDAVTRLPVDISFENFSGVTAQETMAQWREQYPDHMIFLIAIVKQFLVMRNLNEVATGGLGGLSIICLVVSFLQLNKVSDNLGEALLHFLDYYGNEFNFARDRIIMDPPRVVPKGRHGIDGRVEKPDRLSIQDPNNSENNISGGSHAVKDIFKLFSQAHEALLDRMDAIRENMTPGISVLESILGGNYSSYHKQWELMRNL
ncbi:hypothetical protein N0V90_000647 [Kalmusia sp. IMI 367209]|nr:hypothetical protein N0V90_000647 [Kalmusia sp. IMI 367209]